MWVVIGGQGSKIRKYLANNNKKYFNLKLIKHPEKFKDE